MGIRTICHAKHKGLSQRIAGSVLLIGLALITQGCGNEGVADSGVSFNATEAAAANCVHAVKNGDAVSFLNTCNHPISVLSVGGSSQTFVLEGHSSVDKIVEIPAGGLSFGACRPPYQPHLELNTTFSCTLNK